MEGIAVTRNGGESREGGERYRGRLSDPTRVEGEQSSLPLSQAPRGTLSRVSLYQTYSVRYFHKTVSLADRRYAHATARDSLAESLVCDVR